MKKNALIFALSLLLTPPLGAEDEALPDTLRDIGGRQWRGEVTVLNDTSVVIGGETLPLAEVWEIVRRVPAAKPRGAQVYFPSGVLQVGAVTVENGEVRFSRDGDEPITLPASCLSAIRIGAALGTDGIGDAWEEAQSGAGTAVEDRLLAVDSQGRLQVVPGAFAGLDEENLTFIYRGKERKLARASVYGVVLAGGGKLADGKANVDLSLADGSRLKVRRPRLDGEKLVATLPGGSNAKFDWQQVERLELASPRLTFLSDRAPVSVSERTLLAPELSWQRDRNVLRQPLTVGGRACRRGLGVRADCNLRFALDGAHQRFAATVGLDPAGRGGDCICRIELDGREIFRRRVRAAEPPVDISLEIRDARQIELIVEHGQNLDLGDYVNWAEARVLR